MDVLKPMMQAYERGTWHAGTIGRQRPQDVMFERRRNPGPFTSIADYFIPHFEQRNFGFCSPQSERQAIRGL